MAHIKLPAGQATFSAPTVLCGPKSISMFQKKVKSCRAEAVPQNFHSAFTTAKAPRTRGGRIPGRLSPPARRGKLTAGSSPEPPSPTRASPRPPAPAARPRAASTRRHRPSAASAKWRLADSPARLRGVPSAAATRGGVPGLRAPEPRVRREPPGARSRRRPDEATPCLPPAPAPSRRPTGKRAPAPEAQLGAPYAPHRARGTEDSKRSLLPSVNRDLRVEGTGSR